MSDVHTHGSDSANGSLASSPPRRRPARGDLEDDGNIGCADVSTARGIGDRSLLPVPPQRSPNDRRLARPPEPARPAREPNPCSFACLLSRPRRPIKPTSTESEADPVKWIFSTKMAQHKALILFKLNSHAKTARHAAQHHLDPVAGERPLRSRTSTMRSRVIFGPPSITR
jgi:hypothetical protein